MVASHEVRWPGEVQIRHFESVPSEFSSLATAGTSISFIFCTFLCNIL